MAQWICRFLIGLALLPIAASANDGAYEAKVVCDWENICTLVGENLSITWDIAIDDVGRSGAIYVAAQLNEDEIHYYSANGWSGPQHNAYNFLETFRKLPAKHDFVMFQWGTFGGSPSGPSICDQMSAKGIWKADIWLGYGAVQDEAEEFIESYQSIAVPEKPEDHFRIVFAYEDGRKAKKYSKVVTVDCQQPDQFTPGWPKNAPTVRHVGHPERDFPPPTPYVSSGGA